MSNTANKNARNLLDMALVSIENQYTSLIFHREYSTNLRREERKNIVSIAKSIINNYYLDFKNGRINEPEAKRKALQSINEFKYDDGNGYIWINNTEKPIPRILIHPIYPEYNNKISTAPIFYTSVDSTNIPKLAVDLCKKQGSGFIEYSWVKPTDTTETKEIPKISYVELFEPWQWILGTGVYIEDIENDVQKRLDAIIEELKHTIGQLKVTETGYFYIFNGDKQVLLHPTLNEENGDSILQSISEKIPYNEIMQASHAQSKIYEYIWNKPTEDKEKYIYKKKVFVEYFEPLDWYICVSIYEDELLKAGKLFGNKILLISIIFLVVSIAISIHLSSSISKPLKNLMRFASKISNKEDINISEIPETGSVETREMGRVLKEMLLSIEKQKKHLIDAKQKAEESKRKLASGEEKYRKLFESSNDAIFIMLNQVVTDCNQKALELFQCTKEFLIGHSPHDFSPEYQYNNIKTYALEQEKFADLKKENPCIFEWKHSRPNGENFDALVSLNIVELDDAIYVQAVTQDVTEKKRTEKELEEYRNHLEKLVAERTNELKTTNEKLIIINKELHFKNEIFSQQKEELEATLTQLQDTQSQLIHSEKMASLGILTAGVAHEINNPLNFILGGTSGLENILRDNELMQDQRVKTIIGSLKTGAERIATIVKGLNQFSRDRDVYDESCDIHSILENCLTILHNQFKNRIEIQKKYFERSLFLKGNAGKLHQAFLNIIQNSIHSISEEGTITISTKKTDLNIIVEIIDTGTGISEENLTKVTAPFFTTKEPGKGTGLGLSITYTIINEHKGRMEFFSKRGQGTTVRLTFQNNINS